MNTYNTKRLVLISGASRGIGKAFADHYRSHEDIKVIGIGRSDKEHITKLDLFDDAQVERFVQNFDLKGIEHITYMHAVGIDKFEPDAKPHIDHDGDGIDDEVYATNVTAFLNLAEPLIEKTKLSQTPMTIINIGSVSDIFAVPYWQSFSRAKNMVRKYMKSIPDQHIKNVVLNVSTTLDEEKNRYGRIQADTTYWQTSQELVSKSFGTIERMLTLDSAYLEADFYKHNPHYRSDYFTNLPKLFAVWQRDMGFAGKEVPHGIRI